MCEDHRALYSSCFRTYYACASGATYGLSHGRTFVAQSKHEKLRVNRLPQLRGLLLGHTSCLRKGQSSSDERNSDPTIIPTIRMACMATTQAAKHVSDSVVSPVCYYASCPRLAISCTAIRLATCKLDSCVHASELISSISLLITASSWQLYRLYTCVCKKSTPGTKPNSTNICRGQHHEASITLYCQYWL